MKKTKEVPGTDSEETIPAGKPGGSAAKVDSKKTFLGGSATEHREAQIRAEATLNQAAWEKEQDEKRARETEKLVNELKEVSAEENTPQGDKKKVVTDQGNAAMIRQKTT